MSVNTTADSALGGIRYYMEQARRLSVDQARSVLATELSRDGPFQQAWREAQALYLLFPEKYLFGGDVMEKECYLAIISYTLERPNVCKRFNASCRAARATQSSWEEFPFKSLWFFLVRAFEKLPPYSSGRLFRGVKTFHSNCDGSVTFGQFVSASKGEDVASRFGHRGYVLTLDGVPAELVRDISAYSIYERHREVLIWPFCNFRLVSGTGTTFKNLEFVSATPWVERGSRTQLITTSLVGTAPGITSKASPLKAAQTTTSFPEIPKLPPTPYNSEFPSVHFNHLPPKIVQPRMIIDATHALPGVPMTSSRMQSSLLQTTCTLPRITEPSVGIDKLVQPEALCRLSLLRSAVPQVTSSLEPIVPSPAISGTLPAPSSTDSTVATRPLLQSDLVVPDVLKTAAVMDLSMSSEAACTAGTLLVQSNEIMPKVMRTYETMYVSEACSTSSTMESPLPQTNQMTTKVIKTSNVMDVVPQTFSTVLPQSNQVAAAIIGPRVDRDMLGALPTDMEFHLLQSDQAVKSSMAADMPNRPGTLNDAKRPVPQTDQVTPKIMGTSVVVGLFKPPEVPSTMQPPVPQSDQIMPKVSEPSAIICASEALDPPSTTGLPPSEQMSKMVKIRAAIDMSPNMTECLVPQLYRTTKNMKSSKTFDHLETPETLCTMDCQHPQSSQVTPKIIKPGLVNEVPEMPDTSCTLEPPMSRDYSVMGDILNPVVTADVPLKSSHTNGKSLLPHANGVMPSALTIGEMSEAKAKTLKSCGTITAVPKELALSPLNMDNVLAMIHVLPGPKMQKLCTANPSKTLMSLAGCAPRTGLAVSGLVDTCPYTVMPPARVWPMSSAITDDPLSISSSLIISEVMICNSNWFKSVQASLIALLILLCVTLAGVMVVINCFVIC